MAFTFILPFVNELILPVPSTLSVQVAPGSTNDPAYSTFTTPLPTRLITGAVRSGAITLTTLFTLPVFPEAST